jgi:hypothetical protein
VEAAADWDHLQTPETYLGSARGGIVGPGGAAVLDGDWTIEPEKVVLERAGGSIGYGFHARDAHAVLARRPGDPIPFRVLVDGEPPGASHGVDVDADGRGLLDEGRMYQLVRAHDTVRDRTLQITFEAPGAEGYSFTFG